MPRFWGGQGRTFPSSVSGPAQGWKEPAASRKTEPAYSTTRISPGKHFTNPFGNYLGGVNLSWQIDIYRQLRNARDAAAQRYVVASERRNYFVTRLVAEIAENYYGLVALDARLANLDRIIALQERSLEIARARKAASPRHRPACPAVPGRGSQKPERKADRQSGHHPGREPYQLPRQSLPSAGRTDVSRDSRNSAI